jgi:heptosyltransferase-2
MLQFEDIKFDCQLYNGYKPCVYGNFCPGCPHYKPWDPEAPGWMPGLDAGATERLGERPRILIIKTGALGDVLRTTTLLHPLRRKFPQAHVTWITAPSAMPLLAANPLIDELVAFNDDSAPALLGREFDLSVCLEKEGYPLVFAGLVPAGARVGYVPTPWSAATVANAEAKYMMLLGVSDDLKFHKNTKSYPEIICEAAGLLFARDPYVLKLTPAADAAREKLILQINAAGPHLPVIGLNTGCGAVFRTKQWTLEGWAETARTLVNSGAAHVVLMGGEAERELNRAIRAQVPGIIDAGVENSLEEFFGIVDACDIVVTSDSLGMHIAIALKKYVVALFGSTSHTEIDLFDRGEKVITDFACSPCYLKDCLKNPTCMQAMAPATVIAAVRRGMEQTVSAADAPA